MCIRDRNLIVQNDDSVLDISKPMPIFGSQPRVGSKFYIGSWEIFQKKLIYITLKHQWIDLPTDAGGFVDYYKNYSPTDSRKNAAFKIDTAVLDQKKWDDVFSWKYLFRNSDGTPISSDTTLPTATEQSKMYLISSSFSDLERDVHMSLIEEYDNSLDKGFIRLALREADFGNKTFPKDFSDQAIALAKEDPPDSAALPNTPYLPMIENLSIYYKSSVSFNVNSTSASTEDDDIVEQFFHIEPFGNYEVDKTKISNTIVPKIEAEGSLFIGIDNIKAPQTLSLLIQVAEGSANPEKEQQEVTWYYLSDNNWLPFDQYALLSDSTNGLLTSGIITLDIQRNISIGNSRLSPDLYWLKASVAKDSDAVCDIIDIKAQAINASFVDQNNDPKFLENALEAGTISKLLNADASVKKIEQPYASSDGKPPEKEKAFYTRVSAVSYTHLTLPTTPYV